MTRPSPLLVIALIVAAVLPTAACSAQESASDKAFGAKVRAYLLAHPEVLQEATAALQAKEDAKAAAEARAALTTHRREIEHDPADPVAGNPAGKVVLTEFFDYRCPYCKASAPSMPALLKRHPDVRFVYKEFPILSPESEAAARLALAAAKQGKYSAVHLALMAASKLDDATIDGVLTSAGVDVARAKIDAASPEIAARIAANQTLARAIGVTGTPAFALGDTLANGWSEPTLEAALVAAGSKPVG